MRISIAIIFVCCFAVAASEYSLFDIHTILSTDSKYCPGYVCKDYAFNTSKVIPEEANHLECVTCDRCQCDGGCGAFGDCCPSKALQSDSRETTYECVSLNIKGKMKSYFMITTCPQNFGGSNETMQKCEHPSSNDPKTTLPVKSKYNEDNWTTYRNQYCALCWGIPLAEMTSWNVFIDCTQYLPTSLSRLKTFDDAVTFVMNNHACKFEYMPLVDYPERKCKVYSNNIISSCNVTGKWLDYNATLERYCIGYFAPIWIETSLFSNTFCAVCNTGKSSRSKEWKNCVRPVEPPPEPRGTIPPLSLLINFNPTQYPKAKATELEEETVCNCSSGNIFDSYSETCRKLLCQEPLNFDGNDCTSIVGSSTGLTFSLSFLLTPDSSMRLQNTQYGIIADHITHVLNNKLTFAVTFLRTDLSFRYNTTDETLRDISVKTYMIREGAVLYKSFSSAAVTAVNSSWVFNLNTQSYTFVGAMNPEVDFLSENSSSLFLLTAIAPDLDTTTSGINTLPTFKVEEHVKLYTIENEETRQYVLSGVFQILRVSALYNCSQVSYNRNEYSSHTNLPEYWLNVSGRIIGAGQYERFDGGTIQVCSNLIETDNIRGCHNTTGVNTTTTGSQTSDILSTQGLVTLLALSISILCLILTLITYLMFKELRTLPGKNTMLLIITLIIAQVIFLLGAIDTQGSVACKTIGVLLHYFWLASFFWMNVCSLHVFLIFRDILRSRGKEGFKRFLVYCIYAFSTPAIIVTLTIVCFHLISGGKTIGYGRTSCYLSNPLSIGLAFALPLGLIIIANLIFFAATLRALREAPKLESNQENRNSSLVYIRLSSLTGVTWILGFVAAWTQEEAMWYLFIVFCGGQGVYIFLAFICNKRILKLYRRLLCGKRDRKKRRHLNYNRQHDSSGKRSISDTIGDSYQSSQTQQTNFTLHGETQLGGTRLGQETQSR